MAQPMICDGPDSGPALFLVQNIAAAEVSTFCLACMLDFSQALLQAFDPGRLAPPPAKPGRKRKAAATPAVADDTGGDKSNASESNAAAGTAAG